MLWRGVRTQYFVRVPGNEARTGGHGKKFMDVHLMIVEPMKYAERFAKAGADLVTIHYEAVDDPAEAFEADQVVRDKIRYSVKPATPVSVLEGLARICRSRSYYERVNPVSGGQGL